MSSLSESTSFWRFILLSVALHILVLLGVFLMPLYQVSKPKKPITASIGVSFRHKAPQFPRSLEQKAIPQPKKPSAKVSPPSKAKAKAVVAQPPSSPPPSVLKKEIPVKSNKSQDSAPKTLNPPKQVVQTKVIPKPKAQHPPKPRPQSLPSFKLNAPKLPQSSSLSEIISTPPLSVSAPILPDKTPRPRSKITYSESDFKPSQRFKPEISIPNTELHTQSAQMPNFTLEMPRIPAQSPAFESLPALKSNPSKLRSPQAPNIAPLNIPTLPSLPQTLSPPVPIQKRVALPSSFALLDNQSSVNSLKLDPFTLLSTASKVLLQPLPQTTQTPQTMLAPIAPQSIMPSQSVQPLISPTLQTPQSPERIQPLNITTPSINGISSSPVLSGRSTLRQQRLLKEAQDQYNSHIKQNIIPKFDPRFSPDALVKVELRIAASGRILSYKVVESSKNQTFDLAVNLAIQNTKLKPLPESLGKKPPYVVVVHVSP